MNPETNTPDVVVKAADDKATAGYSTFTTTDGVEYARMQNGAMRRLTPKPLSKKERAKIRKAANK